MKLGIGRMTLAALALLALSAGCASSCPCGVTYPDEPIGADAAKAPCAAAAANMDAKHCKEARTDFVAWCTYTIGQGIPLRPSCMSRASNCSEVDKCR